MLKMEITPIVFFQLYGCDVVGVGYIQSYPVAGVDFSVNPYDGADGVLTLCSVGWEYRPEVRWCPNIIIEFDGVGFLDQYDFESVAQSGINQVQVSFF